MVEISSSIDASPSPIRETRSAVHVKSFRGLIGGALLMGVPFIDGHRRQEPVIETVTVATPQQQVLRLFGNSDSFVRRRKGEISFCIQGKEILLQSWKIGEESYTLGTEVNAETIDSQIDHLEISPEGNLIIHFDKDKGTVTIGAKDVERIADTTKLDEEKTTVEHVPYHINLGEGYNEMYASLQYGESVARNSFLANFCPKTAPLPPLKSECTISVERRQAEKNLIIASSKQ